MSPRWWASAINGHIDVPVARQDTALHVQPFIHWRFMMRRSAIGVVILGGFLLSFVFLAVAHVRAHDDEKQDDSRIKAGFRIAPVPLNFKGKNRERVGLGSYLVNAVGGCNDCHTC